MVNSQFLSYMLIPVPVLRTAYTIMGPEHHVIRKSRVHLRH
jgi:hypothetical protein